MTPEILLGYVLIALVAVGVLVVAAFIGVIIWLIVKDVNDFG